MEMEKKFYITCDSSCDLPFDYLKRKGNYSEVVASEELIDRLLSTLSHSFILGLRIAAPTILATAAVYLAVGVNSRLFPQASLSLVSFNINALLTLVLFFLCIGVFCQVFESEITRMIGNLFIHGAEP